MNGSTKLGGFENLRIHLQIVLDSLKKCIQRVLLSNLQTRFKSRPQDLEAVPTLKDFDIEDPTDIAPSRPLVEAGDVEAWIRLHSEISRIHSEISSEEIRRSLVRLVMWLCAVWVLIGLVIFVATGSIWLLVTTGVLAPLLRKILDYYFPHRK